MYGGLADSTASILQDVQQAMFSTSSILLRKDEEEPGSCVQVRCAAEGMEGLIESRGWSSEMLFGD